MEYSACGTKRGEYKSLKPGIYEVRAGILYQLEDHDHNSEAAASAAADKVVAALRRLLPK
jgi:hypothetical protein